jgi:uncharacterized membrane protein YsdA (DUF1294 family)
MEQSVKKEQNMKQFQILLAIYCIFINLITFVLFYRDKKAAIRGSWRIPERRLLGTAFLGGALGGLLGMYLCHHKTKKAKFYLLMPIFLILQAYLYFLAFSSLNISLL